VPQTKTPPSITRITTTKYRTPEQIEASRNYITPPTGDPEYDKMIREGRCIPILATLTLHIIN
jgi:hypothetical protein